MKIQKYCLSIAFVILSFVSFSEPVIIFQNQKQVNIGKQLLVLEDKSNNLKAEDVLISNNFKPSEKDIPNMGLTTSSFWIKFFIKNSSNSNVLLLEVATPLIEEIEFYTIKDQKIIFKEKLGTFYPFYSRKFNSVNYIFELKIPQNQINTYLIKVKSKELLILPITLGSTTSVWDDVVKKDLIFGIYLGVIVVMLLYNLFIYFSVKDKSYIYYVAYILFVGLTQTTLSGYTFKYIWPDASWMNNYSVILFSSFGGIAAIEFFKVFLHTKNQIPSLHKGLNIFNFLFIISLVLLIWNLNKISFQIVQLTTTIASLYVLFCDYRLIKKGDRAAKFFMLAWSILLLGAIVFILKDYDIVPYNTFTLYAMQIGSGMEVILLSFALADKINILKKEKEESQLKALEILKENEKIVKEQNTMLESRVQARTEELSETLHHLKETQSQLVSAEKMASLGQLTAGIAHEINNPINFVMSNITPLKRDIKDVFFVLSKYGELTEESNLKEKLKEINNLKEELDTNYLVEEIDSLLGGIHDGASRTAEIVKGMKNFSRLDEFDLKKANINEGLDMTLTILGNVINSKIKVIKTLGNLPEIECSPGKINQVFMNIISNAAQAITEQKTKINNGLIEINSTLAGDNIIINIKDNGIGMSANTRKHIFEPFFTTKEVGIGTGLGLSIAYSIIKSHNGEIRVESEEGKGSLFSIVLPINQP